ncbi:hypothetical protein RJ640_013783 [Escallonia rubra]|uniref:RecA-like N-terminal domain-containing protein n=1 Tax=Escallonia rubra TaxID=112253 RepID=A0AA88QR05_9ASTE|nr:hypothetical protein RJ640_013783 [Escallonia rubra]
MECIHLGLLRFPLRGTRAFESLSTPQPQPKKERPENIVFGLEKAKEVSREAPKERKALTKARPSSSTPSDTPNRVDWNVTIDKVFSRVQLGNGRARGVIEIYDPETSGKTTLALHIIAEAQKLGGQLTNLKIINDIDACHDG